MAGEKMQNENKKSLNTREDNVAEDIRREAAGKDAEMAADKTTEKEGAPKKKKQEKRTAQCQRRKILHL